MKKNASHLQYSRNSRKQTSFERQLARELHDPVRIEYGKPADLGAIKAVRLG